ncbi:MAG: SAM-dependent methyltransferase, partial [Bacteroidales bacterium]|nr:SAM-dependent methyltransferase [Bacteroidales bacterium]
YELGKKILLEKLKAENIPAKNILDYSDREPTYPEFLGVSGEKIFKLADGTYRRVKVQSANKMGRDIMFIERNLSFLKPGGRMAIVLPQGRYNNSSDKYISEYIAEHCRLLAVVGLHGNVFKPHTGTKTSVLLVQKWDKELCPKQDDYPIFFATMQEPSKDNSGDKIYVRKKDNPKFKVKPEVPEPEQGKLELKDPLVHYVKTTKELDEFLLDSHDHLIVKHDLFNHGGLTQDGIAEAFLEFAKKEKLSFVGKL